jgi:hypothetical protein
MLQSNGIRFHCHDPLDRKTFGSHGTFANKKKIYIEPNYFSPIFSIFITLIVPVSAIWNIFKKTSWNKTFFFRKKIQNLIFFDITKIKTQKSLSIREVHIVCFLIKEPQHRNLHPK